METTRVTSDSTRETDRTDSKTQKSDRFAKLLAEKRHEADAAQNSFGGMADGQLSVAEESKEVAAAAAPREVDHLATEIAGHIAARGADSSRAVEIQFNSNTLEGLRVQVHSEQGVISVNLQTAAPHVARLLTNNLSNLRSALERKGAAVSNLVVNRRNG